MLAATWIYVSIFLLAFALVTRAMQSIDAFGAIAGDTSARACAINSAALGRALAAANMGVSQDERTVLVPANKEYHVFSTNASGLISVEIKIRGTLILSDNISAWPVVNKIYNPMLLFKNCTNLIITGQGKNGESVGVLEGQGYNWWVAVFENKLKFDRPHLIEIDESVNISIFHLHLKDSPRYHISIDDAVGVEVGFVTITVNVIKQKALYKRYDLLLSPEIPIPIFPLNTDGIDIAAKDVYVHDCSVENFDDSVCVKPAHQGWIYSQCTENFLVERIHQSLGVGMSIGSVPPSDQVNCVRNVTFRDMVFTKPFKAIYVKTNPGDQGSGIISNVLYENIMIDTPIWWGIYIGPQQQEQPGRVGPGCMLYPIKHDCPTQPLVTLENFTLRNVSIHNGVLFPGILRCNATNPCRNFTFDNVHVRDWDIGKSQGYICENIFGSYSNSTPPPSCFQHPDHDILREDGILIPDKIVREDAEKGQNAKA